MKMLVNFSLESLGTEIRCDKVSSDGYEPTNLLQFHRGWGQLGFLAERFIKPPVTITLTFPCPIQLSHIIVDPQVGSQRSSAFEIYTAVRSKVHKPFKNTDSKSNKVTLDRGFSEADKVVENIASISESEPVFKKVGFIRCSEGGCICFSNPSFHNSNCSTVTNCVTSCPHCTQLHHHQSFMLTAVDYLSLRIVGTINSSVVAIGRLEVWGEPARACPQHVKEDIFKKFTIVMGTSAEHKVLASTQKADFKEVKKTDTQESCRLHLGYNAQLNQDNLFQLEQHNDTQSVVSFSQNHSDRDNVVGPEVPDEFFDALTFDIMSIPMLLPSGHSIDVVSLERFSDAEATYGRPPSDPFTGLSFTATRKPVLNKTLKMRIDRFLSEHSNDPSFQNVPRALGVAPQGFHKTPESVRKQESSHEVGSKRTYTRDMKHKFKGEPQLSGHMTQQSFDLSQKTSAVRSASTSVKKMKFENKNNKPLTVPSRCQTMIGNLTKQPENAFSCEVVPMNCEQFTSELVDEKDMTHTSAKSGSGKLIGSSSSSSLQDVNTNSNSHEERLQSSLKSCLFTVLGKLPTFTSQTNKHPKSLTTDSPQPDQQCSTCRTWLGQMIFGIGKDHSTLTYMLPCKHLMCRTCLIQIDKGGVCHICHLQFKREDVIRTHV